MPPSVALPSSLGGLLSNILWAENTESIGQAFKSLTGQTSGLPVCS